MRSVSPISKNWLPRRALTLTLGIALSAGSFFAPRHASAAEAPARKRAGVGAVFESLTVGPTTYQRVEIRSVNDRTVMISHSGGLTAVRLRDLPPELQQTLGYNPAAEALADAKLQSEQANQQKRAEAAQKKTSKTAPAGNARFEQMLQNFGRPPELQPLVDPRAKFFELSLNAKNQGPRPSCAIFAIVSALEYQNAQLTAGEPERFSEEYLLWATCKTLNRAPRDRPDPGVEATADSAEDLDNIDEGFALSEVVTAIRAYGVVPQRNLPYSFDRASILKDPPKEVIEQARNRRNVSVIALPGHDQSTVLANLIHALNAGIPVAVGMRWPPSRTLKSNNYLNAQKPRDAGGHAVTIVGYENKTGAIADTVFIFKNSWGARWGAAGFGYASYRYLFNNLMETAVLEVAVGSG